MSDPAQEPGQWPSPGGVPAQPLPYVIPHRTGRPALVTAIGVLSIVFGSIGGFWGLITTFQAIGFYFASVMSSSVAAAQAKATQAQLQTAAVASQQRGGVGVGVVGPQGMSKPERDAAVAQLARLQPLTPTRRRQLETILAASGQDIAPAQVSESGTMPQMRTDEQPPTFFVTPRGRLEVFNDRAVFLPQSGAIVRASAPPEPPPGSPAPPAAPNPPTDPAAEDGAVVESTSSPPASAAAGTQPFALTPTEVQAVVTQAQTTTGNKLNRSQMNSLRVLLSAPGQQLVPQGSATAAVLSAQPQPDGTAFIVFAGGGSVTLGPQGNVVRVTAVPTFTGFSINPVALGLMLVTSLLLMALAVYLLVCGILTLRQSTRGRRLHLIYAIAKIPLSVAAGVASAWVMRDMVSSFGGGAAAPTVGFALFTGAFPILLGCAYPVALLIALNLRSVREYYQGVTA